MPNFVPVPFVVEYVLHIACAGEEIVSLGVVVKHHEPAVGSLLDIGFEVIGAEIPCDFVRCACGLRRNARSAAMSDHHRMRDPPLLGKHLAGIVFSDRVAATIARLTCCRRAEKTDYDRRYRYVW